MNITHTSNGFGIKGTDIVLISNSTAPTSSTGVGVAGKGSECVAIDTGEHYINKGTKTVPSWKKVATEA